MNNDWGVDVCGGTWSSGAPGGMNMADETKSTIKGWHFESVTHSELYLRALLEMEVTEIVASKGDVNGDYSGGVEVVGINKFGFGYVVGWSWGSCSACDDLRYFDEIAEDIGAKAKALLDEVMIRNIKRFEVKEMSPKALTAYLAEHFNKGED